LSEFDDDWRDLDYTPKVDAWIGRTAEPWGTREADPEREGKRGRRMTADEFAEFRRKGDAINYGEARMEKQILNDERHEKRAKRHPLIDVVTDYLLGRGYQDGVVKPWDCTGYLSKHLKTVRNILALPRNARRRGQSTSPAAHQRAWRSNPEVGYRVGYASKRAKKASNFNSDRTKTGGPANKNEPCTNAQKTNEMGRFAQAVVAGLFPAVHRKRGPELGSR
jgi:hypothetical protein